MTVELIEERVVEGMRLGRHRHHDPRNLAYPVRKADDPIPPLHSVRWSKDSDPILDQGSLGSCTGNATVGAMLCSNSNPIHDALSHEQLLNLDEDLAKNIYSAATKLDPFDGEYPPTDTGSDGPDAAKAARDMGYISGWTHALSLADALVALMKGPIIVGTNWYSGMDEPNSNSTISPSGTVRGGHEYCIDELDADEEYVWMRNSWSPRWGAGGRARLTFQSFGRLLSEGGDGTSFVPRSVAPPQPLTPDQALAQSVRRWAKNERKWAGNEHVREALLEWEKSKGLS